MIVHVRTGRACGCKWEGLPFAVAYERPIAFRSGVYIETYKPVEYSPLRDTVVVEYAGLRRLYELARHFDPKRLI